MKKSLVSVIISFLLLPTIVSAKGNHQELSCYYDNGGYWKELNKLLIQDSDGDITIYEANSDDLPDNTDEWDSSNAWSTAYYTYSKLVVTEDGEEVEYDMGDYPLTSCPQHIETQTKGWLDSYHRILIDGKVDEFTLVKEVKSSSTANITLEFQGNYDKEILNTEWLKKCSYETIDLYFNNEKYILVKDTKEYITSDFTLKQLLEAYNTAGEDCPPKLYLEQSTIITITNDTLGTTKTEVYYKYNLIPYTDYPLLNVRAYELALKESIDGEEVNSEVEVELEEIEDCETLLGNPTTSGTPSYYLVIIFDVLKYVAIILIIVLTIMDFIGAVAAQDNDAIKKATAKAIKRLIMCAVIFVLPTLIEFALQLIYNREIGLCGIGG